jgi:hypothetical protein
MRLMAPYAVVDPPPATPPPHGLRDSARRITGDSGRWEAGVEWVPEACIGLGGWTPYCNGDDQVEMPAHVTNPPENPECQQSAPVMITVTWEGPSLGSNVRDDEGRLIRQLEAGTSKAMERELEIDPYGTGNFALANSTPTDVVSPFDGVSGVLSATAVSPSQAIAMLSQALASASLGSRGMIHAPIWLAELWAGREGLVTDGPRLVTRTRGDVVVAGSGYSGTGPTASPGNPAYPPVGQVWAYATGMVEYRLGEPTVDSEGLGQALDRKQNLLAYTAQRTLVMTVDECITVAVLVDLDANG